MFSIRGVVLAAFVLALLIAVSGCLCSLPKGDTASPTTTVERVVCNPPYIRVGRECCLDRNENGICDRDEPAGTTLAGEETATTEGTVPETAPPTIQATTTIIVPTTIPQVTTTVQTAKHKACVVVDKYGTKKCQLVAGAGPNECSDDFSCLKISNGKCVDGACVASGIGNVSCELDRDCFHYGCVSSKCVRINITGEDECMGPSDSQSCWVKDQLREYHYECQSGMCVKVDGAGTNQCDAAGDDPKCRHRVCQADKCVEILTPGASNCFTDETCAPTHGVCDAGVCKRVAGAGRDECTRNSQC